MKFARALIVALFLIGNHLFDFGPFNLIYLAGNQYIFTHRPAYGVRSRLYHQRDS